VAQHDVLRHRGLNLAADVLKVVIGSAVRRASNSIKRSVRARIVSCRTLPSATGAAAGRRWSVVAPAGPAVLPNRPRIDH